MNTRTALFVLCALGAVLAVLNPAEAADGKKPVLLYSRYFNAAGETRYLPDGTYKDVLTRLRAEFDVDVHGQPLNARTLAGVKLLLIANTGDKAVGDDTPQPRVPPADTRATAAVS